MKFSCNQDTLSKYLSIVSRVVSSRPGLPILNNVLFDVSKGKLSMTVTDLEISLHCWIGADVMDDGKITVPAKQISEFVNSIPSEKIDALLEGNVLKVSTLNNAAQFNTIPADDYPVVPNAEGLEPLLKLKKEDVLTAVGRVAFASASDDIKPVLTGIRMEINNDIIGFVAADGLRLSRQNIKLSSSIDKELNLLIPSKAFVELAKIISDFHGDDDDDFVTIYYIEDKNQVLFRYNDIDLVSRLIDGQFPEYRQIIPTGFQTKVEISKSEFANSIKVVNIIARNVLGNKIVMDIKAKDGAIKLSAVQSEVGSNESAFASKGEGEDLTIGFSAKFLSDMLNNIGSEDLLFEATTPVAPGVFKIKDDDSYIHLVMPMRI